MSFRDMKYFLILILAIGIISCKKIKKNTPPQMESASAYLPGKAGSYWIFQRYRIHGDSEIMENAIDSVWQEIDETFQGKTYKSFKSKFQIFDTYMRDSLHYLLNTDCIIMTTENTRSTLYFSDKTPSYLDHRDLTIYKWGMQNIQTPYGLLYSHVMSDSNNIVLKGDPTKYSTSWHRAYAQGIGCVMYEAQFVNDVPQNIKMRYKLIRYKLQ